MPARTFHHSRYDRAWLERRGERRLSVCLPARECAATVAPIVAALLPLVDEVVVVDAASEDGTADIARSEGAIVHQEAELLPRFGAVLGKGDAMWRALSVLTGELVCFLDADNDDFSPRFASGLFGPLLEFADVSFVKAAYRRPYRAAGVEIPDAGGRVSRLVAQPALALFYPELAWVLQPLAGEVAGRAELLRSIPFATGYGVEIEMLLDVIAVVGAEGMAQVDFEAHRNAHQSLSALSRMSYVVLRAIAERLERDGRLDGFDPGALLTDDGPYRGAVERRPPLAAVPV